MTEIVPTMPAASAVPAAPTPAAGAAGATGAGPVLNPEFDTFLKMLTAQIRNQDPLSPMDSADYAVQLATFSGVEQQIRGNELLGQMLERTGGGGLADLSGWVGREVRAAMPVQLSGQAMRLELAPAPGAESAELVVTDAGGRVVGRHGLGPGAQSIDWAGGTDAEGRPLPEGLYDFEVVSFAGGAEIARETVETYGRVREVRLGPEGPVLRLEGGAEVAPGAVSALREGG
ncbi:flagellar hook capping FlgD N-terminal domain-containing protein [Limimaricola pyoseonensis]|uniref:Basal-body rod modification protein FlgD n=1 Tax=Limimaricola pyoseonensis TaxID=521013 RepID=A0A1G7EQD6_9RHOB|nr:flagellar hook capping FlgD N-terminal domain-containing protein [Limimaricola pyoseonensis]SDE65625.1 flagellar basal-body rod modification protein FlgD [Limimaricola pyoseonensis]